MEQEDVEHVALDPLAAVGEAAQIPERAGYADTGRRLHGLAGAQNVGHRADPADPRRDIGRVPEIPSFE